MFSKLSLLQRVALAAALPVFVLGLVLQHAFEAQVRQRALSNAVASARLIATLGIQPQLSVDELSAGLGAEQVAQLDHALVGATQGGQLARLKIWNGQG